MVHSLQAAFEPWTSPVSLDLILILEAVLYLRGWIRLRLSRVNIIPAWRVGSFLLGMFLIWLALGSPLAAFDEKLLTAHMVQHLLLMTIAPPLILVGAPVMPLLHGLPRQFVHGIIGRLFRWSPMQQFGRVITQPAFCWIAAAVALVGWHIPVAFTLGLQSETWHIVEHVCFLGTGFLFWWPVVQPWPSVPVWPRWSMLLYLFLATIPCDILSGFLVFCDRVVYPVYLVGPRQFGVSALEDQQRAAALMWTCVTIIYLIPAMILTTRLLGARSSQEVGQEAPPGTQAPRRNPQTVEAA